MKIAIIGGGPAGMMAAYSSKISNFNNQVDLYEKNEKLGKKMYITGKGRCNVTNYCENNVFFENVVNNSKFLYSAIHSFNCNDVMSLLQDNGVKLKVERGNRVFPESDKSSDIISCFLNLCKKNNVNILLNQKVEDVYSYNEQFCVVSNNYKNFYDKIIITTGGCSYKHTGSTGDGYLFAKKFGHTIIETKPALSAIKLEDNFSLAGLSLKNVTLSAYLNNKLVKSFFGEMLFTHNGISGPIVLSLSSYINRLRAENIRLEIDLKPALTKEQLLNRIDRDIKENLNKKVKFLLSGLLPSSFVSVFASKIHLDLNIQNNSITNKIKEQIVNQLKKFVLCYKGLEEIDLGIVTSGGIDVNEVNPKTMESKLCKGLYFAGEVLNLDALTGGFNMQIAFSTGYLAGLSCSKG